MKLEKFCRRSFALFRISRSICPVLGPDDDHEGDERELVASDLCSTCLPYVRDGHLGQLLSSGLPVHQVPPHREHSHL